MSRPISQKEAKEFNGLLHAILRELAAGSKDPAAELPLAQMRVCKSLSVGPQAISAISRELGVSLSAVTQIADRLERAKLVRRVAREGDRRVRQLQLTDRCQRMMRRHEAERVRRMGAAIAELSPKARKEAAESLKILGLAAAKARRKDSANNRKSEKSKAFL
jgi:DNA-binding MarR family transcriptional regulator